MKKLRFTTLLLFALIPALVFGYGLSLDFNKIKDTLSATQNLTIGDSLEQEVEIGRAISGRLLGAHNLMADNQLQQYVNKVGRWVASQSERSELQWQFGVIDADSINAFSAPGGYIFLTKGLYQLLNSEAELAAVLAHEIGHVVQKHQLKILKKSALIHFGRLIVESTLNQNQSTAAMNNLVGYGAEMLSRGLDKKAEFDADKIGVVLTARAGYNAYALPIVLQEIGHAGMNNQSDVRLMFKTHPHPNERLDKLAPGMEGFSGEGEMLNERFYRI
ncbi:MAG: M48 family metalloprotease [Proteobacteria bacterium]|nr:M48 family metalloprotease [Pseudomonadota bacterium]